MAAIASRIAEIIDRVAATAPGTPIYLQSVFPRKTGCAAEVIALNQLLAELASGRADVHYLDLWPALATRDHALNPRYTIDGLHLNGAGYEAWVRVLRPVISKIVRSPTSDVS